MKKTTYAAPAELNGIHKVSAVDAVVANLKAKIQERVFKSGDSFPCERELQAQLGVSRLTLREALARLAALGIIRVRHGKGAFVSGAVKAEALGDVLLPMLAVQDSRYMSDLVDARGLIEGEMAARAAEHHRPEDIRRLEALLDCDAATLADAKAFARRDLAFHEAVARIAGNDFLTLMHTAIAGHIEAFLVLYARAGQDRPAAMARHRAILDAIRAGDAGKARTAARDHSRACKAACGLAAPQQKQEKRT